MAFFNPAILFACVLLVANQAFVQAANVAFEIRATWATGSPDGNSRKMIMVNDQFPGPQLTVNQGDQVQFTVHNALPFDLSVHFHGIEQKGTPWSDGVPGVSQRPIKPGQSFEYSWTATQHGVYWYHAHLRGLMMDGLYGTILIHPPADEPRPFSTISPNAGDIDAMKKAESNAQTVLISDWTKFTSEEWYAAEQASGLDIYCVDSILVNGKGSVECQPQSLLSKVVDGHLGEKLEKKNTTLSDKGCAPMLPFYLGEGEFPNTKPNEVPAGLQSGCKATNGSMEVLKVDAEAKWASLHFVSAMSLKVAVVSVDEHPMWIYAIDGQYIKPQIADTFILHNGERVSAMIKLDQTPGDYTIRIANNLPNQVISGYAKLSYARGTKTTASKPYIDYGSKGISDSVRALDDNKLIPFNAPPAAPYANQTIFLSLHRVGYNWAWTLNNKTSFSQDRETIPQPLLFTPNTTDPVDTSLIIHTQNNTWVDIVFQILLGPENRAQPVHAMHKHSNRMYLLGRGNGPFPWPDVQEARKHTTEFRKLEDAQYRDTVVTASTIFLPSWTVVRYKVDNPGAWILHCHMMTHLQGGMAVVLMDGIDAWPEVPGKYRLSAA